jgi:hypothetical protein
MDESAQVGWMYLINMMAGFGGISMDGLGGGEVAECRMDWAREMLRVDGVAGEFGVGCEDEVPT